MHTGLSKRNGAKLRESFCPAAASHSRPCQAGALQKSPFFLHKPVHYWLTFQSGYAGYVQVRFGQQLLYIRLFLFLKFHNVAQLLQPADIGWLTGNGKKLSCSQAQLGQATCLAAA